MASYIWAIMFVLIGFVIGFLTECIFDGHIRKNLKAGRFIITKNDPTQDFVRIDLDVDLPEIEKSRVLKFQVVINGNEPVVNVEGSSAE